LSNHFEIYFAFSSFFFAAFAGLMDIHQWEDNGLIGIGREKRLNAD
jgi:hypothetical protein